MYEIKLTENPNYYDTYHYISKNDKGQLINLILTPDVTNKHVKYYVQFYIGKRKHGYQFGIETGKDGLKSLIWAKNCIKDFIVNIQKHYRFKHYEKHSIVVQWDNNKRRNAYHYGLKPLGFYYGVDYLKKSLIYKIR